MTPHSTQLQKILRIITIISITLEAGFTLINQYSKASQVGKLLATCNSNQFFSFF